MENVAAALEALGTYDLESTKKALAFLIEHGDPAVVGKILPLTAHPDVAIRYFAKRAVAHLRSVHGSGGRHGYSSETVPGDDRSVRGEAGGYGDEPSHEDDIAAIPSAMAASSSGVASDAAGTGARAHRPAGEWDSVRTGPMGSHGNRPEYFKVFVVI